MKSLSLCAKKLSTGSKITNLIIDFCARISKMLFAIHVLLVYEKLNRLMINLPNPRQLFFIGFVIRNFIYEINQADTEKL